MAAFSTSWEKQRDLAAAQLQEEPGQKVNKLASVIAVLRTNLWSVFTGMPYTLGINATYD